MAIHPAPVSHIVRRRTTEAGKDYAVKYLAYHRLLFCQLGIMKITDDHKRSRIFCGFFFGGGVQDSSCTKYIFLIVNMCLQISY